MNEGDNTNTAIFAIIALIAIASITTADGRSINRSSSSRGCDGSSRDAVVNDSHRAHEHEEDYAMAAASAAAAGADEDDEGYGDDVDEYAPGYGDNGEEEDGFPLKTGLHETSPPI